MHYRFIAQINDVSPRQWNDIAGINYPFLRHEFLSALESSGSVCKERGWQPQHLLIEDNETLVAILPLYIKTHSYGEYVFDWAWADAYQRHGLDYYPKLLSAIPFTPATGKRMAMRSTDNLQIVELVKNALNDKTKKLRASGWHVLFPMDDEIPLWQTCGAELRLGCQFHWHNHDFVSFDDFLATMSSRKRKDVKKERRKIVEQDIRLQRLTGKSITPEHWQQFYYFYQQTYLRKSGHGGYLTLDFFLQLHLGMPEQLLLVLAFEGDEPVAAALNLYSADTLYGRYWGAAKDIAGLHFETCYYQGIEFCIEQKLQRFDAGAQGEHKIQRGFVPTITHSLHWIAHPQFRQAINDFLQEESKGINQYRIDALSALPFKTEDKPDNHY